MRPPLLLSPKRLAALLSSSKNVKVLDASWHMPNLTPPRNGFAEFKKKRLTKEALFWDVDRISTPGEMGVGHMLPNPATFAAACSQLGIGRDDHVVVHDSTSFFSAPRTAFTFRAYGHENVSILDGGLPRWEAEGHPVVTDGSSPGLELCEQLYSSRFPAELPAAGSYPETSAASSATLDFAAIAANGRADLADAPDAFVVLDARPPGRFTGSAPEPRPGLSSGHMPNSYSVPFSALLAPGDGYSTLKSPAELEAVFAGALGQELWENVKAGKRKAAASCGSGMTAGVIWAGMQAVKEAGVSQADVGIYDESWTGYAQRKEAVILKD